MTKKNSYDGKSVYLISIGWIDIKFNFKHVKPGNYKLFINQIFLDSNIKEKMIIIVLLGDKSIYKDDNYPSESIMKNEFINDLKESFICNIEEKDFKDVNLDARGDAVVNLIFQGKNNNIKKKWVIDGARLLEVENLK